ncbi:MAG: acyltransferase [Lachnospiraceae bacterium]|nr:acyltransferase [Lachnospiraceae bacterium]
MANDGAKKGKVVAFPKSDTTTKIEEEPEQNTVSRNQNLDALRGLAIILVMMGHCIVLNQMEEGIIYDAIKAIQMPLFMIASGFTTGMMKRINTLQMLGQKIRKRAIAYLVPFVSWLLILQWKRLPREIWDTLFQLDRGLWFLVTLFILTVIMYVAMAVKNMTPLRKAGFLGVWFLAGSLIFWQNRIGNHFLSPHLTLYYMPFYFLGNLLYRAYRIYCVWIWRRRRKIMQINKTIIDQVLAAVTTTLLAGLFIVLIVTFDMIVANNKIELMAQMTASLCGCFLCMALIHLLPDHKCKQFLSFIGNYTLEIYVIHYHFAQILGMADKHLSLYSFKGVGVVALTFVIMSVLTTVSITLLKQFKITNFLLFGKNSKARESLVDRILGRG